MARTPAPQMPTPKQIEDAHAAVCRLHPGARIVRVGPNGVEFEYPDRGKPAPDPRWDNQPFSA